MRSPLFIIASRLLMLAVVPGAVGCGIRELPAPESPPSTVPTIPEVAETAPREGTGRLLIASEGEPAKVSRVIETWDGAAADDSGRLRRVPFNPPPVRRTELLCIAPCAADLSIGAHSLVFASTRDSQRTSTADVAVSHGTTVVRHVIGVDKPISPPYVLGVTSAVGGAGLTLMGALALTIGLTAKPTVDDAGRESDPKTFAVIGGVIGGVGLAALVTGIVLMTQSRPERRAGVTTSFRVP